MISKFTKAYARRYRGNGQITAYVEWIDGLGRTGRTEGGIHRLDDPRRGIRFTFGTHMHALFHRAKLDGITATKEIW